tara:strand:- start:4109 stop:4291 length:183 start_codon:yes stop_codon:yes gene_type:complete
MNDNACLDFFISVKDSFDEKTLSLLITFNYSLSESQKEFLHKELNIKKYSELEGADFNEE